MNTLKKIASCAAVLCLTVILLLGLGRIMEKKDGYRKHAEFFEQQEDFDVLFIGASHIMNAALPMELWEDHGIVSYNMAQAGHPLPSSYWVLRCALEETTPKLVVLDCYSLHFDIKTSTNYGLMHTSFDSFPMSLTKVKAVYDLLDDPSITEADNEGEERKAINLLWNYSVFHARWDALSSEDFVPGKNYSRGALTNIAIHESRMDEKIPAGQKQTVESVGLDYLRMIIEECQGRGIEVLLTWTPFPASVESQETANFVCDIAAEYGINYINFLPLDVVNYATDMADNNAHLNIAGARKFTDHIGRYIVDNYDIPDRRGDERYTNWERDFVQYTAIKDADIAAQTQLCHSLLLLYDDSVDAVISVRDKELYKDALILELMKNLGFDSEELGSCPDTLLVKNGHAAGTDSSAPADSEHDISISIHRGDSFVDNVSYNYVFDSQTGRIQEADCIR